jgi:hypothetical protein
MEMTTPTVEAKLHRSEGCLREIFSCVNVQRTLVLLLTSVKADITCLLEAYFATLCLFASLDSTDSMSSARSAPTSGHS